MSKNENKIYLEEEEPYDPQFEFEECCKYGDEECGISILQNFDINPLKTDEFGTTPIHAAAANGLYNLLIEILKKPQININIQNEFGNTPLHYAALNKNNKIIKLLVENGANPKIKNLNGQTPLYDVCSTISSNPDVNQEIESVDLLIGPDNEIPENAEEEVDELLE